MALKDMKSDLSKFRMPKKEPLKSKENPGINKNLNKTPLSSMAESAPKIPRSTTTVNKEGVNPQKVNQTEKFKGETTPKVTTNVEKFKGETTPKPMSLEERYLGQTDPKLVNQTEKFKGETNPTLVNQTEKFKGETSPTEMSNKVRFLGETTPKETNNQSQFLGETNPKEANNQSQFLGETTPNNMDTQSGEKFLGETTPKTANNSEQFLGETTPKAANNSEQFLGETTPTDANNSEQFLGETTPKVANNSEQYLGETTPKIANNSEQYLGETSPKEVNNQSQFLGETTPTEANNQSKFLGETTPNTMDVQSGEKFLGETTPTEANNSEQFLGETTPTEANNQSKFLGETTPNESDRSSKFLGETTPTLANNESKFLGETTPNESDRSSKFLGETTPLSSDRSSKFLGETSPTPMNIPNGEKGLGETTPTPMSLEQRFLGETSPNKMNIPNGENGLGETTPTPSDRSSKFLGETSPSKITQGDKDKGETSPSDFTFSGKLEKEGRTFKEVNNLSDIHSTGFNSRFGGVEATKFVGVNPNNTVFDGTNSLYSNIDKSKFSLGKTYEQAFDSSGRLNSGEQGFGIGKGHAQRKSPSFLDDQYSKFNLRDDAHNSGLGLFRHPLILRGIQRKKKSKGEPQVWGLFGFNYDEGALRGGIVTSTVRALVDVARIGKWFASVPGILWGVKQFGLQRSQRFGKIWTPVNMLAAIGGQHIGLRPMRGGIIPINDPTTKYGNIVDGLDIASTAGGKIGQALRKIAAKVVSYDTLDLVWDKKSKKGKSLLFQAGNQAVWKSDKLGGFNSLYGINISGPSEHKRAVNTFTNPAKDKANEKANFIQAFNGDFETNKTVTALNDNVYNPDGKTFEADSTTLGRNANNLPGSFLNNKKNSEGYDHNIELLDSSETIKQYETIAYGKIPVRVAGDTQVNDFRMQLKGAQKTIAEDANYVANSLQAKMLEGQDPSAGTIQDRGTYSAIDASDNVGPARWDVINALRPVASEDSLKDDLVPFYIQPIGTEDGLFYQFRGTITGLTETFSPSWDSIKFSGRADQGYKYGTFERSVSFNFQMWATSRIEMKPMYEKLEALSTFTMPEYHGSRGYQGMLMKFTLGDLYKNKLSFIDSLTYTYSDDAPWDLNLDATDLGVRPMGIDVAIGFKVLDEVRPQYLGEVYDLGWERGQ